MATKTFYPATVAQNSATWIAGFTSLNNIKVYNNDYAYSTVNGKSATKNTPAKITATNFNVSLPTGAKLNKITVQYKQRKTAIDGHYASLPAPKITLLNTGLQTLAGTVPGNTPAVCEKVFAASTVNKNNIIGNSNFGVVLEYQKNTNEYSSELWVYWVRIIVDYTPTIYGVSNTVTLGEYTGDEYRVRTTLSNVNKTEYTPTVTITAPAGFNFREVISNGGGEFTEINSRTFTWQPEFKTSTSSLSLEISYDTNVTIPSGDTSVTLTYTASESLNGTTKDTNITVKKHSSEPIPPTPDSPTDETEMDIPELVFPDRNVWVDYTFTIPVEDIPQSYTNLELRFTAGDFYKDGQTYTIHYYFDLSDLSQDNKLPISLKTLNPLPSDTVSLWADTVRIKEYPYYVATNFVNPPNYSILEITGEELDRLGDNIPYTLQCDYHLTTSEDYYVPISKNYKLGVFNNPIEANITRTESTDPESGETIETVTDSTDYTSLTPAEIISNAEYWSNFLPNINVNRSMECKFVYNSEYPLYIIITGDYASFGRTTDLLTFNTPCIIETEDYTQRTVSLPYYTPIQGLVTDEISTITLDAYTQGSSFKLYNPNLDETFGTGDNISIRGIEVLIDLECSNTTTLTAKLKNPDNDTGSRSTIIDTDKNTVSIGGIGDLYGYLPTQLTNLTDWTIEIETNNVYPIATDVQINNIELKIYYVTITKQEVSCYINGEDISYYGAFIQDVNIPAGLKTSTSFLSIDGTDTNDAYRQNIKEKEIELTLEIGDCTLLDSTNQLQELTQLIVNDKDQYNRPIPKRVEFSHYPNLYWEYIIEDTFTTDIDISTYELKIKLTVPSGTAYKSEDTIVYNSGYVHGLASVNPIITIKPTGTHITLTETETQQDWHITYTEYTDEDIYIIDCENRTVTQRPQNSTTENEDTDITSYVDFNSDWFTLDNNFVFDSENCIIQSVQYTERW